MIPYFYKRNMFLYRDFDFENATKVCRVQKFSPCDVRSNRHQRFVQSLFYSFTQHDPMNSSQVLTRMNFEKLFSFLCYTNIINYQKDT